MNEIRISGKDLGAMALPDFCPRCFYLKRKAPKGIPFQIFPGIFSSIDAYVKRVVHTWFDNHGVAPSWLLPYLEQAKHYLKAPHHTKFRYTDPATGIVLSGVVDDLFECCDYSHIISDYKTAKFTPNQDKLLPMYEVQLNAYAVIDEGQGNRVSSLLLHYCEPVTDQDACTDAIYCESGFDMGFTVKTLPVPIDPDSVFSLLKKARNILDLEEPPKGADGCKDCEKVDGMLALL